MSRAISKPCSTSHIPPASVRAGAWLRVVFCLAWACIGASCVKLPRRARVAIEPPTAGPSEAVAGPLVNLNTAPRAELEQLPGIGPALAARIIEHRARYGPFRRAEHLLIVRGISERRFARMQPFVEAK